MKLLLPYFAACAMAAAATLNPGDAVKPDAIGAATLIQGEVPKEWEKDKVYVLECWATWCGPCVAAIPHVNELYTELKEKGLRVIGMNVWEDDKDKVEKFVKDKGEGMSYPVVFVSKTGPFADEWLKAAEVRGIPHAFVVKNGKLLFSTHPSGLTKELVGDLLAGGEKEAAAVKSKQEAAAAQGKVQSFMSEKLRPLLQAKDFEKAAEEVKTFIKDNPTLDEMSKMSLTLNANIPGFIEKGDADGAAKFIDELVTTYPDSPIAKDADRFKEMIKKQIEMKANKGAPKPE